MATWLPLRSQLLIANPWWLTRWFHHRVLANAHLLSHQAMMAEMGGWWRMGPFENWEDSLWCSKVELGVQNFSDKAAIVKSIHLHNFHCTSLLTQHSSTWLSLRTRRRRDKWPCTPNQRPLCKWQFWQVAREGPEKGPPVQPTLIPQGSGGSGFPNPGSTWVNWRFPQKSGSQPQFWPCKPCPETALPQRLWTGIVQ